MMKFQRLVVAMDLTEMDDILLEYVRFLTQLLPDPAHVILLHNIKHTFPRETDEIMEELEKPLVQYILEDLEEKAARLLPSNLHKEILIEEEESTAHCIAETANERKADLVIVGKKINYLGSGIVPSKLLRLADMSLLFVPESAYHLIQKILVPTDFSRSAQHALRSALFIQAQTNANLFCQHVYHIPMRYFPYIPVENMRESMRQQAEKEYKDYLKRAKAPHDLACRFTPGKDLSIVQNIHNYAVRSQVDFMVIGHKGKTMFVGSVAEGLSNKNMHIPLLVVKHA